MQSTIVVFTVAHANRSNGNVFGIRLILIQIFFGKAKYFIYHGAKEWGIKTKILKAQTSK